MWSNPQTLRNPLGIRKKSFITRLVALPITKMCVPCDLHPPRTEGRTRVTYDVSRSEVCALKGLRPHPQ